VELSVELAALLQVSVDGTLVERQETPSVQLAAIRSALQQSGAKRYRLLAGDAVTGAGLVSFFQAAQEAGFAKATLMLADGTQAEVGFPATRQSTAPVDERARVIGLVVHADQVLVQSREQSSAAGYSLPISKIEALLPSLVRGICGSQSRCDTIAVRLTADARVQELKRVLVALSELETEFTIGAEEVPAIEAHEVVNAQTTGSRKTRERLPAETIRSVVRAGFGGFRSCYEDGLVRNANLTGRVTVAFVVNRDGSVTFAQSRRSPKQKKGAKPPGTGTTISDEAVIQCVVQRFKQLRFPAPSSGRISVVYPIEFSPAMEGVEPSQE
jgi:hypothetical protein